MELRKLQAAEVKFLLEVTQDDVSPRGNALASGDSEVDKQAEDEILARLQRGDVWAWASVKVTAQWQGFLGVAYLGCCTYSNEEEFKLDSYYTQLCNDAMDDLHRSMLQVATALEPLIVEVTRRFGSGG